MCENIHLHASGEKSSKKKKSRWDANILPNNSYILQEDENQWEKALMAQIKTHHLAAYMVGYTVHCSLRIDNQ